VGTPEELYTRPQNVFVAGFIGSPAMNIVPVDPAGDGGRGVLERDGFRVELPERLAARLQADRPVVVGFRPEHLQVAGGSDAADGEARIPATVDVVEYLGDEQLVHLHAGEVLIVAKVPVERRLRPDEDVVLRLPSEKLHLFDRESEQALGLEAG